MTVTPSPQSVVTVEVSGLTGSGKSAVMGEIEIALKALGLTVEHDAAFQAEKNGTHADWQEALDLYRPTVVLTERNVSRAPAPSSLAGGEVTDEWADRFCEAVNWSPDGQECKTVEGELRCTTFRQIAKGHILSAIATNPYPDNAALSPEAPAREGDRFVSIEVERMESCLSDLRPADNKNTRAATAYNYLLSVTRLAALTPRHEAPAEPWYGDRDPQEVDQAYGSYDGTSCELCKRERVMVGGATGRRICEKCGLYQEAPAEGAGELIATIRTRLIGVSPDDQDVVLEDSDWLMIVSALEAAK